jgi:hypothetical protein
MTRTGGGFVGILCASSSVTAIKSFQIEAKCHVFHFYVPVCAQPSMLKDAVNSIMDPENWTGG